MNTENPYSATSQSQYVSPDGNGKFVPQVRIVAILMIVQAVLEILFGAYYIVMGFMMPAMMAQQQPQLPAEQLEVFNTYFFGFFFVAGGLIIAMAGLRLVAGILGVTYRGRILGIISHIGGFLMVATCYCFPTAIALGVYLSLIHISEPTRPY